MPNHITSLSVQAFRGATKSTDLEFQSDKTMALLFGENGTGKSTIADAIDFVLNGEVGSLAHCKLGKGKTKESFVPSLDSESKDVKVVLEVDGHKFTATHTKKGAVRVPQSGHPTARILRRSDLLQFVTADPAERYKQVTRFIDVSKVETSEATLREAARLAKDAYDSSVSSLDDANTALQQYWESEGRPRATAFEWAKAQAALDMKHNQVGIENLSVIIAAIPVLIQLFGDFQGGLSGLDLAKDGCTEAEKNLAEKGAKLAEQSPSLLDVLKSAKVYFAENEKEEVCPVCERAGIKGKDLFLRLGERVQLLKELDEANTQLINAKGALSKAAALTASHKESFDKKLLELCEAVSSSDHALKVLGPVDDTHYPALLGTLSGAAPEVLEGERAAFHQRLLESGPKLKEALDNLTAELNKHTAIVGHYTTVSSKQGDLAVKKLHAERMKKAHEIVESMRKEFVSGVLGGIATQVNGLYQKVHPGEELGDLKLLLDPAEKGSLKFEGKFHTSPDVQPQAYYSESHLDTLGICIFLALARSYGGAHPIIVLDDVFTSTDHAHLDRIVDLLHEQAQHCGHLIVTTHYQPWRTRYRYNRGPAGQIQLVLLRPWTLETGIRTMRDKIAIEDLEAQLKAEPISSSGLASAAGVLLESALDHLTLIYQLRLPRKTDGKFTLGDLQDAVDKKLVNVLRTERSLNDGKGGTKIEVIELKPLLELVRAISWPRNEIGAHFNLDAAITEAEVVGFAKATMSVAQALVCPMCGELPRALKDGTSHHCHCGASKLYPAVRPE